MWTDLWILVAVISFPGGLAYKNIRLQDTLCSDALLYTLAKPFRGDPTVRLEFDEYSGSIVTQTWNLTLPLGHAANKIKYNCQFRVVTNERPPRGIYTIITKLKFRKDPVSQKCIDYIQFSSGNRPPSEKICNDIAIDGHAGRLIFDQRDRDVNIHIYIERDRHIFGEPLELRMVLTAHSECQFNGDFLCNPKDPYSCISRHFVGDNVTNCLFPCRDEGTCFHDVIAAEEMDTTNVAISAITSLIFTMLGVGFCVWVCWKYWNCITVQQRAHEASAARFNQRRARSDVPTIELPTAPSYDDVGVVTSEPEQQSTTPKDLPPSYESLFPDR
ncbi:uncharacterized protein Dwil_GK22255 [Drosophila willistoni]|uniref:CUB domain-containing protein n=1 Tax=Drosophila willistoni TaxID=7260 RepID=B4MYN8_DROWI|nr:uncharacterized protein LOC6643263 [Drosophila willistoni]EDW77227.1 uncharacterized protein Dwil_GK22255 [Drosophila willistoni]